MFCEGCPVERGVNVALPAEARLVSPCAAVCLRIPQCGMSWRLLALLLTLLRFPVAAAETGPNRVEPLSSPIRLAMTAEDVIRVMGPPRSDNRSFGGGLGFPGLLVMFDSRGTEIWSLTITGGTRLACGIGVGDPRARVQELFPGVATTAGSLEAKSGQYALSFWFGSDKVERIVIRPSGARFAGLPDASRASARPRVDVARLEGRWIDPRSGQSFELRADGGYRTPTGGTGRVAATTDGLAFTGVFAAWNEGRATVTTDLGAIEFQWTNPDGSRNYFAFLRAEPPPAADRR
jgi:hypothetical protein